jgi:methyl-accepting chemotaxis protein
MKHLDTKLAVTILGSLLATSLLTGTLVIQNQRSELERGRDRDGQSLAMTMAAMLVESMLAEPIDTEIVQSQIRTAALTNTQVLYVAVHDAQGRLIASFPPEPPGPDVISESSSFVSPILVTVDDLPVEIQGKVQVILDNARFRELTRSSILRLGAGTLYTFLILAFLFWFFIRRNVLGPVAILDRHVARLVQGDLSGSIVLDRVDEFGRMASVLEAMRFNLKETCTRIEAQFAAGSTRRETTGSASAPSEIASGGPR